MGDFTTIFMLSNTSTSALGIQPKTELMFCAHSIGGAMLQIGDGEMIEEKADEPIPLGDLQPRREIILHLLAGSFWGGYILKDIKANLVFSADELGKVAYKLPLPFYQRMRWRGSFWLLGACVWHIDLGGNRGFSGTEALTAARDVVVVKMLPTLEQERAATDRRPR